MYLLFLRREEVSELVWHFVLPGEAKVSLGVVFYILLFCEMTGAVWGVCGVMRV